MVNDRTVSLPAAANQTSLSLSCITDSLSNDSGMVFDWFFRGNLIDSTSNTRQGSPRFEKDGSLLNVTGGDLSGSYQCIAKNIAGSVSTILFVYGE